MLSLAEKEDVFNFDTSVSWNHLEQLAERALQRLPSLEDIEIIRGWSGLRTITPDQNAILGEIPKGSGFYCAIGFSGHGIMHAPAVGKLIAEMITKGKPSTQDISDLRPDRFHLENPDNQLNIETLVI